MPLSKHIAGHWRVIGLDDRVFGHNADGELTDSVHSTYTSSHTYPYLCLTMVLTHPALSFVHGEL